MTTGRTFYYQRTRCIICFSSQKVQKDFLRRTCCLMTMQMLIGMNKMLSVWIWNRGSQVILFCISRGRIYLCCSLFWFVSKASTSVHFLLTCVCFTTLFLYLVQDWSKSWLWCSADSTGCLPLAKIASVRISSRCNNHLIIIKCINRLTANGNWCNAVVLLSHTLL